MQRKECEIGWKLYVPKFRGSLKICCSISFTLVRQREILISQFQYVLKKPIWILQTEVMAPSFYQETKVEWMETARYQPGQGCGQCWRRERAPFLTETNCSWCTPAVPLHRFDSVLSSTPYSFLFLNCKLFEDHFPFIFAPYWRFCMLWICKEVSK